MIDELKIVRYTSAGDQLWIHTATNHDSIVAYTIAASGAGNPPSSSAPPRRTPPDATSAPARAFGFSVQLCDEDGSHVWSESFAAAGEARMHGGVASGPFAEVDRAAAGRDGQIFLVGSFSGDLILSDHDLGSNDDNAYGMDVFIGAISL